jgi:hypothetical protein
MKSLIKLVTYVGFGSILSLLPGCFSSYSLQKEQTELHKKAITHIDTQLSLVERKIDDYAEILKTHYPKTAKCGKKPLSSKIVSIYLPKSAKKGNNLNCLQTSASYLDLPWKEFYESTGFLSWLYVYDGLTKSLRIFPSTNTQAIFGNDLVFDSFDFYKISNEQYPQGTWSELKFDVNGTGRLLIRTKAVEFPKRKPRAIVSIDVKMDHLFRQFEADMLEFARKRQLKQLFLFSYQVQNEKRTVAHDFSTNPIEWRVLRSFQGGSLNILPQEKIQITTLEDKVEKSPQTTHFETLYFDKKKFLCSMIQIKKVKIYSLMCSE